jgi:hypothetical protein
MICPICQTFTEDGCHDPECVERRAIREALKRKSMKQAILLQADDWEMLYINGELKEEGHTLNEGASRTKYFLDLAKKYDFDLAEMKETTMSEEDERELDACGSGNSFLKDYKSSYEQN